MLVGTNFAQFFIGSLLSTSFLVNQGLYRIGNVDPCQPAINLYVLIKHMSKIDYLGLDGNTLRMFLTVLEEMSVVIVTSLERGDDLSE